MRQKKIMLQFVLLIAQIFAFAGNPPVFRTWKDMTDEEILEEYSVFKRNATIYVEAQIGDLIYVGRFEGYSYYQDSFLDGIGGPYNHYSKFQGIFEFRWYDPDYQSYWNLNGARDTTIYDYEGVRKARKVVYENWKKQFQGAVMDGYVRGSDVFGENGKVEIQNKITITSENVISVRYPEEWGEETGNKSDYDDLIILHYFVDNNGGFPSGSKICPSKVRISVSKDIKSISIPDNIVDGFPSLEGCTKLEELVFSKNAKSMPWVEGCTKLQRINPGPYNSNKVNLPNTLESISSFAGCESLIEITIPDNVTSIPGHNRDYHSSFDGLKSVTLGKGITEISRCFYNCSSLVSVTIPNSVTSIGDCAFDGCSGLTSVTIPNSVTSIGWSAFSGCSSLLSVTIPNSVTSIYIGAFEGCSSLTSMTIPNSVTFIGDYAFQGCSGLTSVTIPNSVETIGSNAFKGCSSLISVTIPNSVTSIGYDTFRDCSGLTSVTIPNSVTKIGWGAFYGCSSLLSVTIPNSVTSIYKYTFCGCSNLTTVAIGNSVTDNGVKTIYSCAFAECPKLTDVYCFAKDVPETDEDVFNGSYIGKAYLHVPAGSVNAYKTKAPWSGFKSKVKITAKVELNKSELSLEKGKTVTLKAIVTPSTFPNKSVTWKSSNTKVATVTSKGKVKGIKAGTATITCTSQVSDAKATCKLTVVNGTVTLNKTETYLEKGQTLTLKATLTPTDLSDKSVTWESSDKSIATVTSTGKVKGVKYGIATIICTSNVTGVSATCKVIVGKVAINTPELTIRKSGTTTLEASVYPSSLEDKSVTWESSDTKIATVTNAGKVKGVKDGTAIITCTSVVTGLKAICKVKVVTGNVTLDKSEVAIPKGKTLTLKATVTPTTLEDKSVTWKSSNTAVATVSGTGKVTGVKYGIATITCTSVATGLSTTCKVTVGKVVINESAITLRKNRTTVLTPTIYPSSLTDKRVTWTSSDTKIATVTSEGKVKGIKAGMVTITCTSVATGLSDTCTVTVLSTSGGRSSEGNDDKVTDIEAIEDTPAATEPYDIYDLSGHKVLHQVISLDGLPTGIYIVNGKKLLKK